MEFSGDFEEGDREHTCTTLLQPSNGVNALRGPDRASWFSLAEECENRKPQAPVLADAGQKPLSKI